MTDQLNATSATVDAATAEKPPITKEQVAKYLLANPRLLIDNPDLLTQIQVQLQQIGAVSLTQIQSAQSREKIQQLKSQVDDMVKNARKNEFIYKTYAQLNLAIASTQHYNELQDCIERHLVGILGLEATQIMVLDEANTNASALSEIQQHAIFEKKLAKNYFYFGRISNLEKAALFPNAQAESVALVLLTPPQDDGEHNPCAKKTVTKGLLAIASKDPLHFEPGIDTVLLDYLRQNLNIHLNRLR